MGNLLDLVAKISLDSTEYEKGIGKSTSALSKVAKVGIAAVTASASAIGVLVKKSVDAYAEYEQLAGGIKKLYESATDDMMKYASEAYRTAGMSANAYMQNVTGFSAALLNSVEGNSKEAARIADMAMQDIADNANTFGKYTAEELAGVYQALAKGQYQTLDNLMLGFGGTKEGMQSLIDKANELAKEQGMAGNLQIDSYADIVQAIHLVQGELNITGTTANEAAKTIQGSLNMTKAAWQNLVTGFADPESNIAVLTENVVTSASTAAKNLVPAIMQSVKGISNAFNVILPQALSNIPNVVKNIGVPLLRTGAQMVLSIGKGMVNAVPELISVVKGLIDDLVKSMNGALPSLIEQGLIGLEAFSETLLEGAGQLVDSGMALLMSLAQGIANAMPVLVAKVPVIISNFANIINENLPKILATGVKIIATLVSGLIQAIPQIVANLPKIITAIWNVFTAVSWTRLGGNIIKAIGSGISKLASNLPNIMRNIGKKAMNAIKNISWKSVGTNIVTGIINGIKSAGSALINAAKNLAKSALKGMKSALGIASPSKVFRDQVGMNIALGMAEGIEDGETAVASAMDSLNGNLATPMLEPFDTDYSVISNNTATDTAYGMGVDYGILAQAITSALTNLKAEAVFNIDGKEVARTTAPFMQTELNRREAFANRKLGYV